MLKTANVKLTVVKCVRNGWWEPGTLKLDTEVVTLLKITTWIRNVYHDVSNQQDATTFSFINPFLNQPYMFRATNSPILRSTLWLYIQLLVQCTDTAADRWHGWDGTACIYMVVLLHNLFLNSSKNGGQWTAQRLGHCCVGGLVYPRRRSRLDGDERSLPLSGIEPRSSIP